MLFLIEYDRSSGHIVTMSTFNDAERQRLMSHDLSSNWISTDVESNAKSSSFAELAKVHSA